MKPTRARQILSLATLFLFAALIAFAFAGLQPAPIASASRPIAAADPARMSSLPPAKPAATTWHVTSNADGVPTPGNCPGAGCRLRDAIAKASSGDTIDFQIPLPATITLISGTLSVSNLTISGSTTSTISISGNNAHHVFDTGGNATLSGLTIRDGNEPAGAGGAISTGGSNTVLTLTNTIIISNTAASAGAIWNNNGALVLISSTVSNNIATNSGGGIYNNNSGTPPTLTMTNSTVSNNIANAGSGGGILSGGPMTITNSSILTNTAGTGACSGCTGGGIYKTGNNTMILTNVTVSGNAVYGTSSEAAGIFNDMGSILNMTGGVLFSNTVPYFLSIGGGIFSSGVSTATISGTLVISNTSGFGGGIAGGNFTRVTVINATVISNTARFGGGISNFPNGFLTVSGSTLYSNTATVYGGGIENNGPFTLTNTTISANQTTGGGQGGAGVYNSSIMTATNSTISANQSSTSGGGIYNDSTATTTLTFVTIANNSASGSGGGIYNTGTVSTSNSIIASNPAPSSSPDCSGSIASGGYNLIGNNNGCSFSSVASDQVGTSGSPIDPKLAPLGNYGGGTKTRGLFIGSPALDKIPNGTSGCGTTFITDQRGIARPQNSLCDIGAFEGLLYPLYLPLIVR